jgi:hypothetical protein
LTLEAVLFHLDDAIEAMVGAMDGSDAPPRAPGRPYKARNWHEPVLTGDPVTDAWERAVAAGDAPDLDAPG